jgi:hypothetical protein
LNYFKQIYLTKPQNFSKPRWLEWESWRGKPIEGGQPTTQGGGPATFPAPWWRTKIQIDGTDRWQINTSALSNSIKIYKNDVTKIGADVDDTDPLYPNVIFSFPNLCYFDPDGCQGRTKYATYTLVFKGTAVKDGKEEEITKPNFSSTTIVNVPLIYLPPPPKINLSINTKYDPNVTTTQINSDNYYIFAVTTTENFAPFSDFLKNSNGKLTYNPFYGLNDDDVCSVEFAVTTTSATAGGATLEGEKTGITTGGWIDITDKIINNLRPLISPLVDKTNNKIKVRFLKILVLPQNSDAKTLGINNTYIQNLFGSSTQLKDGRYLTKNLFKNIIKSVDNNAFEGDKLQIKFTCHQDWDGTGYQNHTSISTDMIEETLTFNLTPKSAVLIPKERSEYTGKGTPKIAAFNAKIHIVDATSTKSDVNLSIINSSTNPVTVVVENNSTKISENSDTQIKIGEAVNGRFIKDKIPVKFEYTGSPNITIQVCYTSKESTQQTPKECIPKNGIKIELK